MDLLVYIKCQYSNVINLERDEEENEPDVNKLEKSLSKLYSLLYFNN